jgi:signal transduction histidine kinase
MQWQTEELNRVSWHMLRDREEVARQFSHEMHDELGQLLTGLRGMMKRMNAAEFESRRGECVEALEEALTSVRELSQLLRPVILDDFGLQAGLRWLSERFTQRTQIPVEFTTNDESRMSDELETHLFRIAQEALTNIARHSHAGQAWIKLMVQDGIVSLTIEDDGRGLAADKLHRSSSLGMVGMRARARQVSGDLLVQNRESGGLRVQVQAPLRRMHDAGSPEDSSVVSR